MQTIKTLELRLAQIKPSEFLLATIGDSEFEEAVTNLERKIKLR